MPLPFEIDEEDWYLSATVAYRIRFERANDVVQSNPSKKHLIVIVQVDATILTKHHQLGSCCLLDIGKNGLYLYTKFFFNKEKDIDVIAVVLISY